MLFFARKGVGCRSDNMMEWGKRDDLNESTLH